ncbi:hypothetical protein B296_00022614 [Ensete ventricosum]|uniref:Uncharacterized protein n=1 Tax=Ensete ventricosum TaxID=4639 RepID=A0A427AB84_ENSVE|nr:hypothetical protein B296_00022614 [Ensete ventricosum]
MGIIAISDPPSNTINIVQLYVMAKKPPRLGPIPNAQDHPRDFSEEVSVGRYRTCPTTGPTRTFLAASARVPFSPRDFRHVIASPRCVHSPGTCLRSL